MHVRSPDVTDYPRPVLTMDADPQLVAVLRHALDGLSPRHTLMVIPQPAVLRQYLQDSLHAGRSPAAIVLNMSDPVGEALAEWIRIQGNDLSAIPIVDSAGRQTHPNQLDAAVPSPLTAGVLDALSRATRSLPRAGAD
jgi:hypothetical protein